MDKLTRLVSRVRRFARAGEISIKEAEELADLVAKLAPFTGSKLAALALLRDSPDTDERLAQYLYDRGIEI